MEIGKRKYKFAFLAHPINVKHFLSLLGKFFFGLQFLSKLFIKDILKNLPPYRLTLIKQIKSLTGDITNGVVILCPLLPEQMVSISRENMLKKIISGCKLAKRDGADIIGLGGFTSILSNQGADIVNKVELKVTSGNTFTSCLAIDGVFKAAEIIDIKIENATVCIIGATGNIGKICSEVFAMHAKKIILVARDLEKLKDLGAHIKDSPRCEVQMMQYLQDSIYASHIIVSATSATTTLIDYLKLKPGAVVCDVSVPPNIAREVVRHRNDILVFEGGLAQLPPQELGDEERLKKYFPFRAIYGCLAETMLLALEGRIENFSLGHDSISVSKINEIRKISKKHGFCLADFICGEKLYTNSDFAMIKAARTS